MPRRYAIVDVGSNSIRLVIFEIEGDGRYAENRKIVSNRKSMAGLAGYVEDGELSQEGIDKAINELTKHLASAQNAGVAPEDVHVFATAGLRNISNSYEACEQIDQATGIRIDLLSGEDEARLGMVGCEAAVTSDKGIVIDIGGGSTEITTFGVEDPEPSSVSLPFGSLYLYLHYVSDILPTRGEMCEISEFTREHLEKLDIFKEIPYGMAVGIGGSIRSSVKLVRAMVNPLVVDTITGEELEQMLTMPAVHYQKTLHGILRVCPDRVHTVIPGLTVLWTVMEYAGLDSVKVSKSGLREGYLIDRVLGLSPQDMQPGGEPAEGGEGVGACAGAEQASSAADQQPEDAADGADGKAAPAEPGKSSEN